MSPVFTERTDKRGKLIMCAFDGETGAARLTTRGEQDARDRAEIQARKKAEERRRGAAG